ncbi:hypothetical protein K438DRAFT_1597155 [Mycena galopus ATCC 62051]|nr:hypothetical protein K438DRAFT_1597155 [Mycena galopus ATCC 62051]
MLSFATSLALITLTISYARAETHTVAFTNLCGFGTPTLVQGPTILSTGGKSSICYSEYTVNGPLSAIAYLQTGECGLDGAGCTIVETTLSNNGSSTDISSAPTDPFSVVIEFQYYNGCDGLGTTCA